MATSCLVRLSAALRALLATGDGRRFASEWGRVAELLHARPGADARVRAFLLRALEGFAEAERTELLLRLLEAAPELAAERARRHRRLLKASAKSGSPRRARPPVPLPRLPARPLALRPRRRGRLQEGVVRGGPARGRVGQFRRA